MSTISPKDVALIIDGNNITDFTGDIITVDYNSDVYEHVVGVNSSTRKRMMDESGFVEFTLMRTSPQNGVIKALMDEDLLTNNKRVGFSCVDTINGEAYSGTNCYFQRRAAAPFGEDSTERVYRLVVPILKMDSSIEEA